MSPQMNNSYNPRRNHKLRWLLFIFVVIVSGTAGVLQRQTIIDQWLLYGYTAPEVVANLATQDGMTAYARKIFYVNHPSILKGSNFEAACPKNGGEKTIVLGCYHGGQKGITLFYVTEPLLNGVEQVTAAHEMLHAAYDRLSSNDKQRIGTLLQNYYLHDLHDARLLAIIEAYKISEPNDVVNEMHSVFGSEIATLPQALEEYYRRYFSDRSVVTSFAAKYQAEFTNRQNTVALNDAQLTDLRIQIESKQSDLSNQLKEINANQSKLKALRNTDPATYNAMVPAYNSSVDDYNYGIRNLQSLIDKYNALVISRNAVALEVDKLAEELSNKATTINN